MLTKSKTLTWATLTASLVFATGCLRFSEEKKDAATPVELPKIGLKTSIVETTDLLNPYNVAIEVSAKKYDGLVIVKATEQIPISKPMVGQRVSLKSEGGLGTVYQSLSSVTKTKFDYVDTNVNPEDVFWYAVIRPDADGNSGIIQEQGELPQPTRMAIPAAKADPAVALSSSIVNTGSGTKPYRVKLTVSAPLGANSALKLVRATTLSQLNLANYTNLANITSMPFDYEDGSLYPTDSAVYAVINTGTQNYNMPSPAAITLPTLNNQFTALALTQVTSVGHQPSVKLTFDPVYGVQNLKRFVNGMEVASTQLANGQTEYLDENVPFDKVLAYRLEQQDYYGNLAGSSANLSVTYAWPVMNFATEFSAKVNPKATIHQYEIRAQDLSTINRLLKYQISVDGTNFNDLMTLNETTMNRAYAADFSAPTVRYFRAMQLDRNNNVLATSPTYTLTIPQDREFSGVTTLTENLSGYGRVKLNTGAVILTGTLGATISGDRLISDAGSIRAFAAGSRAPNDSDGRNAGDINLSFKSATGALTINSQGEYGGNGTTPAQAPRSPSGAAGTDQPDAGWICEYSSWFGGYWVHSVLPAPAKGGDGQPGQPGINGQNGFPGKNGGNSGKITIEITSDATGFSPTTFTIAATGGAGGQGTLKTLGGLGGRAGHGSRFITVTQAWMAAYNNCSSNPNYQDNGARTWSHPVSGQTSPFAGTTAPDGNPGADGPPGVVDGTQGQNGMTGQANIACRKLPSDVVPTCN
jgi:hypothetical protein